MPWWQLSLVIWGIGAVAAFPLAVEFNDGLSEDDVPGWLNFLLCLGLAAIWPLAWLQLVIWAVRKAVGHG